MRRALAAAAAAMLLMAAAAQCAPDEPPQRAEVQRELRDILSRPEYNRQYGSSLISEYLIRANKAIERALRWLSRLLTPRLGDTAGRLLTTVLAIAAAGAFLLLLALIIRRLSRGPAQPRSPAYSTSSAGLPSAGPLEHRARQLLAGGDFRGAFGFAYLACVATLDERGLLRFDRSRTNWEYVRQLCDSDNSGICEVFRPLTESFDRRIYGGAHCTRQDAIDALDAYARIAQEAQA